MLSTPGDGGGSSSSGFAARSGPYSFPGLVTNAVDFRFLVNIALIWLDGQYRKENPWPSIFSYGTYGVLLVSVLAKRRLFRRL